MELKTPKKPPSPDLRGVLSTRQGTLGVAIIVAVAAGAILLFAITSYRHGVSAANKQSTVLVAKRLIQKGTSGDAIASGQLFAVTRIAQKQVSSGAISDTATLQGKVAAKDILPGQQLTATDFTVGVGIASKLAPNARAMAVALDQAHGLIGVLQTGDHVDVYGGFDVDQGSGRPRPVMRLLIANVQVLQAPTGGGGTGSTPTGNVVLDVNDAQAGRIAFASDNGKIWLALRPGNAAATPPTFQDLGSVLLGSTPILSATLAKEIAQIAARGTQ